MFRRMLIGALLLVALLAAPAAAQYDVSVTPGEVEAGGAITFSGEGCLPGAEITITLTEVAPGTTKAIGDVITITTITADENGAFTVTFDVPEGTAVGTYRVSAICGGEAVASAIINVVDGTTATTVPGSSNEPIVRTGSDLNGLGLAGAGLITVGGIILIATRSRRHQAEA